MSQHVLVVFTNAVDGQHEEFNDWYDRIHIPDLLKIPEIKSAQRFRLSGPQKMEGPLPWQYMALYTIETDDLSRVISIIRERAGTALMPLTDSLQPDRIGWYFDTMAAPATARALDHAAQ